MVSQDAKMENNDFNPNLGDHDLVEVADFQCLKIRMTFLGRNFASINKNLSDLTTLV